jgi:hypothetical protein
MTASYEERVLRWIRRELRTSPPAGPSGKGILVEDEIHPFLCRPETFGLTHQLLTCNWTDRTE